MGAKIRGDECDVILWEMWGCGEWGNWEFGIGRECDNVIMW